MYICVFVSAYHVCVYMHVYMYISDCMFDCVYMLHVCVCLFMC